MKNLKYYSGEPFLIHELAVNQKNNGERKVRLTKIKPLVEEEYKTYLNAFKKNDMTLISPCGSLIKSKDDLQSLYKYSNKVITTFRNDLKSLQHRTIIATCQNCTIKQHNTLDHILPQEKFPEFVVNPLNLIPCCSTCNGYKSTTLPDKNPRFLNLYLDELPSIQYLFVNISYDEERKLDYNFYLENKDNSVEEVLFRNLRFHYEELHLFERFKLASIEHESEFENTFSSFISILPIVEIAEHLKRAAHRNQEAYGFNHWQAILELELLDNQIFISKMETISHQEMEKL